MKTSILILLVFAHTILCFADDKQTTNVATIASFDSLDKKITPLLDSKEYMKAATLMLSKGRLLFESGMYTNALTTLDNALDVLNKIDEKRRNEEWSDVYVSCMCDKGMSLVYLSNFDAALQCYITIEKYSDKHNSHVYASKAYNGMGAVFATSNNSTLAEEYYKKALSVIPKTHMAGRFSLYLNLGSVFMLKQSLDSAQIYFLDAHKIAVIQKDENSEIASLQSLGMVNYFLKKYKLSLKYYNEAVDIATKVNNYRQLSYLKVNMIDSYIGLGDYDLALSTANDALLLSRKNESKLLEAASLKGLSKLYEVKGDYKRSLEAIKESLAISDSIFSHQSEDKLLKQKADFDLYKVQSEQALVENQLALKLANRQINNMIT